MQTAVNYRIVHTIVLLGINDSGHIVSAWGGKKSAHLNSDVNSCGQFSYGFCDIAESGGFLIIGLIRKIVHGQTGTVFDSLRNITKFFFETVKNLAESGHFPDDFFRSGLLRSREVVNTGDPDTLIGSTVSNHLEDICLVHTELALTGQPDQDINCKSSLCCLTADAVQMAVTLRRQEGDSVIKSAPDFLCRLIDARKDDPRRIDPECFADLELARTAYFNVREPVRKYSKEERIGLNGVADIDRLSEGFLHQLHSVNKALLVKNIRRRIDLSKSIHQCVKHKTPIPRPEAFLSVQALPLRNRNFPVRGWPV